MDKILDTYVLSKPSAQNVLDLFQGEWSSRLPDQFKLTTQPGPAQLFDDGRIVWAEEIFGNFSGWKILELGPLEGGHSYMFQNRNAQKVVAVEANTRSFLKCLCIQNVLELDRVEFKLGDFMAFMEEDNSSYDMVFASGVLYHLHDPVKLIHLASKVSDRLFIWTHYYDKEIILGRQELMERFGAVRPFEYEGVVYEHATQSYGSALGWSGFCGGLRETSKWLTRESIMDALHNFGFRDIHINFDQLDHPNGPAFAICAQK